jgi:hypothetical protein
MQMQGFANDTLHTERENPVFANVNVGARHESAQSNL